ncbi:MAG: aminotransferase class V-fold PLP-dependent enzyme [Halobacteriales archaeon]
MTGRTDGQPPLPSTPLDLRASIPALQETTYFNFGAHGPSPTHVVEAAESFLRRHEFETPASGDPYDAASQAFERTREAVASFVGADSDEIALTESTTAGVNAVAGAIDWTPGDVVVRTDLEHPAGILPWQRLESEGVEVRVVETDDGRLDPDRFAEAVAGADLACFSAVTWTHGTHLPVADLVETAHEAGALALVDAVQVPGHLPSAFADWNADFVAAAGHKWLLGTWGGGFLYADADVASDLRPRAVGYRSVEKPTADRFTFAPAARRFEVGSANPATHVALRAAIEGVEAVGVEAIESRVLELAGRLADGVPDDRLLSPATPESGLVTVEVEDPEATVERLAAAGIVVRSLPFPDAVRASVHAVNTAEEVDRLESALREEW